MVWCVIRMMRCKLTDFATVDRMVGLYIPDYKKPMRHEIHKAAFERHSPENSSAVFGQTSRKYNMKNICYFILSRYYK